MSADTDRRLTIAAARLSHRAPEEWADFLSAFVAYTDGVRDEVVTAPPNDVQVTQGRARACVQLRKIYAECRDTAEKIQTKKPSQPR